MRKAGPLFSLFLLIVLGASASNSITPKTTLAAETGNNTSTANTFSTQTNGNIGPNNVSKVPIRSLLYSGANTRIYTHWMPWFGTSSHMNIGYDSADPAQVSRQVADMASRGIDGAIVDWYGPNSTHHNTATINLMKASQANGQFTFAITEDAGALKGCANTLGCDVTAQAISDLTYVYNTFEPSPAYIRINGRPVIFFFGTESLALDWNRIRSSTPGNPMLIFRNAGGFTALQSDGSFSWIIINSTNPTDISLGYLDNFYSTGLKYPASAPFATGYKGFNDTLAGWGANRIMNQDCGQTWLRTTAEIGKYYSPTNQLPQIQLVTWNDYEEGSEIETGIDNCVTVRGATTGNTVTWSITGQENTVDHYTVFISLDGQNLMPVADVPAGTHSLDLSQYSFDPANYTLYVKAVGKPTLTNKMSGAIAWSLADIPPNASLSVTPSSGIAPITVTADATGSKAVNGTIASGSIDFGDGTVMAALSASHNYASPGTYAVTATVTDSFGGSSRTSTTVSIAANQPPLARLTISPANGIAPVSVTADASASTDPDGKVVSVSLNFGDGTLVNAATASHTYGAPGTYTVTATVTDDRGAVSAATATATVVANQPPVARLTVSPTSGTTPVTVTANASASSDADGKIVSSSIDFGDGTVVNGVTASHIYSTAGTFTVTAKVTDDRGASSSTAQSVTVAPLNKAPVVSIVSSAASITAGMSVTAKASASDPDGTVTSVVINWGDGSPSISWPLTASHVYNKAGTYTISATAADNKGAKSVATTVVTVSWGVVVTAPVAGPTFGSPVNVVAKASSSAPITCIKIYLDNIAAFSINGVNQINTYVTMTSGTHRFVVQAWDSNGVVYKNIQYINVR